MNLEALDAELRAATRADPLQALRTIAAVRQVLGERELDAVRLAITHTTWQQIGQALGVSRQAVFQRFGKEWLVGLKGSLPRQEWHRQVKRSLGG